MFKYKSIRFQQLASVEGCMRDTHHPISTTHTGKNPLGDYNYGGIWGWPEGYATTNLKRAPESGTAQDGPLPIRDPGSSRLSFDRFLPEA